MLENKQEIEKLLSLIRLRGFSIKISEHLHKRFIKHLKTLKNLTDQPLTRQKWLSEAFLEKLSEADDIPNNLTEKLLHFKIEESIYNQIHKKVEVIKKFRNFSKTQWMIEAIYEKLEREEAQANQSLKEKINS